MPEAHDSGKPTALLRVMLGVLAAMVSTAGAAADECAPKPQGEGRVQAVLDARTLRLDDGRIVRLAGLGALRGAASEQAMPMLAALAVGRAVSLHGETDAPDRYGRQRAWAFAEGQSQSLQAELIAQGGGWRDVPVTPAACRDGLMQAEVVARSRRLALWAAPESAKNAESADDISTEIGHFTLIEGRVRSVRTSGGTTYLNFGRRWTQGFAVLMPARATAAFEAAGSPVKGFEGKRVRVRGYVVRRGGPRIEVSSPEQIEVAGGGAATAGTRD